MVSRVARNPVSIPENVEVKLDAISIVAKGSNGELKHHINELVKVTHDHDKLFVVPINNSVESNALAGMTSALLRNLVHGVDRGFERKLILVGVGYRAKAEGNSLNLAVGFSHPVNIKMPEGIAISTPTQTEIVLKGADKQQLCQVAANIRAIRPPEPYKGKGIRYSDEKISLKEAKKK